MFGIILTAILFIFGIFLKVTKDPGFAATKKYSWLLIGTGFIALIGKLIIMYQQEAI